MGDNLFGPTGDQSGKLIKLLRFLLTYALIYSGANAWLFWKIRPLLGSRLWLRLAVVGFLLLMIAGPIFVRLMERSGLFRLPQILAVVTYLWMTVVMWVLAAGLLMDLWNATTWLVGRWRPEALRCHLPPLRQVQALAVLMAFGFVWGVIEARFVRLVRLDIATPRMAPADEPLRILFVSDLHLGLIERGARVRQLARIVERTRPDLILSAGDFLDGAAQYVGPLADQLAALPAPLGKFAVLGNHEWYVGLDESLAFHERAGFRLLRGQSVTIGERLILAGVDDPAGQGRGRQIFTDETACLPPRDRALPAILLKHQSRVLKSSLGRFDLQLSGHTHGGQVFPFGLLVRPVYPYFRGLYALGDGSRIYVTPGMGTWGPPLRVLARPEAVLITLRAAE